MSVSVSVSETFHLLYLHIILVWFMFLSDHLLRKSCSLSRPYVLFVVSLFVSSAISRFGFEGEIWILIAPVPGHFIMKTSPCNEHSLTPHFYIVKLGFTWVSFFLIFAPKHRLWLLVRSKRKAMNRNWCNQKANPALNTKAGNK